MQWLVHLTSLSYAWATWIQNGCGFAAVIAWGWIMERRGRQEGFRNGWERVMDEKEVVWAQAHKWGEKDRQDYIKELNETLNKHRGLFIF